MHSPWVCFVLLAALAWESHALVVGPVRLANNRTYISYGLPPSPENSTLECPYRLEAGDGVVQSVEWNLLDGGQSVGIFKWKTDGENRATGRLDGAVNLERNDGYLELMKLRYDLAGYYTCALALSDGKRKEAEKFQTVIIDTTSNHVYSKTDGKLGTCEIEVSYSAYAVFPEPTVHAGMYSTTQGGFYDQVTGSQWHKQVYENGSVAYSFEDVHFKVDASTPMDTQFRVTMSVVKEDGTNIPLHSITSTADPLRDTRGCPALTPGEGQKVKYLSGTLTCRGEYKPGYFGASEAVVTCGEGYRAEGAIESFELLCPKETLTWSPEPNPTLVCVKDPEGGGDGDGAVGVCVPPLASLLVLSTVLIRLTRLQ